MDRRQVSPEHHMETGVMISFLQSTSHSLHGHWTLWTGAILMSTKDYDAVMNGDLTDGSIILMHDIHEPSVQAAIKMIPELVAKGL